MRQLRPAGDCRLWHWGHTDKVLHVQKSMNKLLLCTRARVCNAFKLFQHQLLCENFMGIYDVSTCLSGEVYRYYLVLCFGLRHREHNEAKLFNTKIKCNRANTNHYLIVMFTTPCGHVFWEDWQKHTMLTRIPEPKQVSKLSAFTFLLKIL